MYLPSQLKEEKVELTFFFIALGFVSCLEMPLQFLKENSVDGFNRNLEIPCEMFL